MNENRCIFCGTIIPEGRQICWNCEHNYPCKLPSEEQIKLADEIAQTLHIDFPCTSEDFEAWVYESFINKHINEAKKYWSKCCDFCKEIWDSKEEYRNHFLHCYEENMAIVMENGEPWIYIPCEDPYYSDNLVKLNYCPKCGRELRYESHRKDITNE